MSARRLPKATVAAVSDRRQPEPESPLLGAFFVAAAEMVAANPVAIMLTYEDAKGVLYNVTVPDIQCVFEGLKQRLVRETLRK